MTTTSAGQRPTSHRRPRSIPKNPEDDARRDDTADSDRGVAREVRPVDRDVCSAGGAPAMEIELTPRAVDGSAGTRGARAENSAGQLERIDAVWELNPAQQEKTNIIRDGREAGSVRPDSIF